ncbi:MAG: asparagine synthase C-terminal domain-containing protein, partial [Hyphomicrobium sp.]
ARPRRAGGPGVGEEAWLARFEAEFGRVIRDQMVADVPVGAFLSGGIDSSAVVAFMMEAASQPVRTYSIGFASEGYNEVNHARAVAQHLGTSHTEYMFSESDLLDILPRVHEIYDEPFADSSQLPTLLVSKIARQSVTVALSGDGGDEVFGGYNRYRYATILQRMVQSVPRLARVAVSGALRSVPTTVLDAVVPRALRLVGRGDPGGIVGERLHKFSTAILDDEPTAIYEDLVRRDGRLIGVETGDRPIADAARHQLSSRGRNFSDYMMLMDALTYLPDDILTKVDRAAMSVSLETRVPFLDHKLFELAWELPDSLRVHGAITKRILRLALAKRVPAALFARPKSGFGVPIDQWLRGPLKSFASEVLFDGGQIDTFLDKSIVRTAWQRHQSGSASLHHLLWNCIVLSNWLAAHSSRTVSGPAAARGGVAMTPGVHHAG